MMDKTFEIINKETVFEKTGIQFMFFNTIYQLMAMKAQDSTVLKNADKLLLIPDLINYFLTGKKYTEYSNASTTQLFNPKAGDWAYELIDALEIDRNIFTEIIDSGTVIGNLSKEVCSELGIDPIPVIAAASHDTGSAVASVPAEDENFAYISCGTWSFMGVELKAPIINEKSLRHNFTNEGGVNRTTRFLKNIMGLWILQESRRQWQREGEDYSFPELLEMAAKEKPLDIFIDPDDLTFAAPGDMPERIREYLRKTGQRVPENKGGIVRCISESLAMKYRYTLLNIEEIIGCEINCIHMVGGGIQDKTLCQFTANATGKKVLAGPIEATALGNIAVQAIAMKKIKDINEARKIIKKSFPIDVYDSENTESWNDAYKKFLEVTKL
jgi:sugar (pentulose or hexulose) kinase